MRFDILSNRPAAEKAMRDDLLKRKYKIKEEQARAATMRGQAAGLTAETGAKRAERRFGPGGLAEEELTRRYPVGLPTEKAKTARISAAGYAGAAERGATTAEGRLELEREEFEFGKSFLGEDRGMPGSPETEASEIAKIKKGLSSGMCPEGFVWDGQQCIPLE